MGGKGSFPNSPHVFCAWHTAWVTYKAPPNLEPESRDFGQSLLLGFFLECRRTNQPGSSYSFRSEGFTAWVTSSHFGCLMRHSIVFLPIKSIPKSVPFNKYTPMLVSILCAIPRSFVQRLPSDGNSGSPMNEGFDTSRIYSLLLAPPPNCVHLRPRAIKRGFRLGSRREVVNGASLLSNNTAMLYGGDLAWRIEPGVKERVKEPLERVPHFEKWLMSRCIQNIMV